jgi:uncharacterized protein involved in outer membrane biogenesis
MKIFKWIVIVVILLIIGAVVFLYINLNSIVKHTVETQGTEQLKVPTTLGGVSLGILQGTVQLSDLDIGSPQGFSAPHMLSLGGLNVNTGGLSTLLKEPIRISKISVNHPKLVVEQTNGKLNFKALMDQLPSNPDKTPAPQQPNGKPPVKLIVDDLTVNDAHVVVRPGIPGLSQEIDIPIPLIDVKNIGNADGAQNGAAIKDVVTTLITQMVAKAADSGKLPPEVKMLLSGNLNDIKGKLTGAAQNEINKVTSQLESKIPGNVGKILGNQPAGQNTGNPKQDLINQGLGALRNAASQPSK